jgi:hypothetical protein
MSSKITEAVLLDFKWYAAHVLKIQTKINGLRMFQLRKIQRRYIQHLKEDFKNNIIRSIVLKPRQSGFSTVIAGINTHQMLLNYDERGIMLADKLSRTREVFTIYDTFRKHMEPMMLPAAHNKDIFNSREMYFENRRSGFKSETQNDPNAGRSGTRKWAHLTEFAFYTNADSIDDGVQNSIPLAPTTRIFKESTAFGIAGAGAAFYNQWQAASRGDSIYKPFFVAWYEVEDYSLPIDRGFILTREEKDLIKMCPVITNENLQWRRLKLLEYAASSEQIFSPEERFCQDFPSWPEEAFLSSGRPVFDLDKLKKHIHVITNEPIPLIAVRQTKTYLTMYSNMLKVYETPKTNERYIIGADVAEGLALGDASTAFVMTKEGKQVASFYGRLDPDHFGHLLVELAKVYNEATLVPEINNMGHTVLTAIKNDSYLKVYMRAVFDEVGKVETHKMGWRTTSANKQTMLSKLISKYRDGDIVILDINLLKEMMGLSRESNGDVELNGQDRVVAACLACMGLDQMYEPATITNSNLRPKLHFETKDVSRDQAIRVTRHAD